MLKERNRRSFNPIYLGISVGILIFAAWLISYWVYASESLTYPALGDSFGALNTLFSGLAFVGVIYAIILQQQSLTVQKQELKKTTETFTEQLVVQEKSARLQALILLQEFYDKKYYNLAENEEFNEYKDFIFIHKIYSTMYLQEIKDIEKQLNSQPSELRQTLSGIATELFDEDESIPHFERVMREVRESKSKRNSQA